MTAPVPISAVLITRNAEDHLERVLEPLLMCDEIVVLDSDSTDRTRDIAGRFGARLYEHPFDGFGPQKRRAAALARNDWLLSIDADEVLDRPAVEAIAGIDWRHEDPGRCWRIRRRPHVGKREIRHGHWVPDFVVRLFNRTRHGFSNAVIHESVQPNGPVFTLPGSLLHYSYPDLAAVFRPDYQRLKAAEYRRLGRTAAGPTLVVRALAVFARSYILKRGFLDGPAGVVVALAGAANAVVGLALASQEIEPIS